MNLSFGQIRTGLNPRGNTAGILGTQVLLRFNLPE